MAASRLSISMNASSAPLTGGNWYLGGVGAEQGAGFAEMAMRVDVDGLDTFSADHDGEFLPCRLLGMRTVWETATAEHNSRGRGGGAGLQEITAAWHGEFLPGFCCLWDASLEC